MAFFLYRLRFRGPVHFGLAGIGLEAVEARLSSDSLTSALVNAVAIAEGPEGAQDLISQLTSPQPPFVVSSLFPFGPDPEKRAEPLMLLVRPLVPPPVADPQTLRRLGKDMKRISYLRPEDFLSWVGETPLEAHKLEEVVSRSQDLTSGWWEEETRPRVALDRLSQNSAIWSQAAIWFRKEQMEQGAQSKIAGSGLYGLVWFRDDPWKERLAAAFAMLGDTGLGGERTYGLGLFDFGGFEPPNPLFNKILTGKGPQRVFLSLYYPAPEERGRLGQVLQAWDFVERRGYIVTGRDTTGLKRKRVSMLVEGSVAREKLKGSMVDVTPDGAEALGLRHRVYRSGLAFLAPFGDPL